MSGAQERLDGVAERGVSRKTELAGALHAGGVIDFIRHVAPGLDPEGVVRVALAHTMATPALQKCSAPSIVRAVMEAAQLSLTVDGVLGHAYLVPYGRQAKMLIGYRGIMALAYASEKVTRFHMDTINENDEFQYSEGVDVTFRHQRALSDRGEIIGAYAIAHLTLGGPPLVAVMGLEEIEARRARSASFKSKPQASPWTTDFAAMCKKTAARELGKVLPVPKLQTASLRDEARDEGRTEEPSTIDVPAEVTDAIPDECSKCGRLELIEGRCPDCEPEAE